MNQGNSQTVNVVAGSPTRPRRFPGWFWHVGTVTLAIVLAGLAWRIVRYAVCRPIWPDEAMVAVSFAFRDYAGLLKGMEYGQVAPLGFVWLELALTRALGFSEYVLRLVPFLCGVASLLLFWRTAPRLVDRRAAMLGTAVLAAAFFPVRHSCEIKPYAGDMLISMLLMLLAWRVHLNPRSLAQWLLLSLSSAIAIWLSYPSIFVAAGMWLFLCLGAICHSERRRAAALPETPPASGRGVQVAGLALFGLATAASFGAMYVLYSHPQSQANLWYTDLWRDAFPPWSQPWRLPYWLLDVHAGNMMAYPAGDNHFGSTFTFLMVVAGCVGLWRSGRRTLILFLLAPLIPTLLAAAAEKYPYGRTARLMLFMAPSFCLLMGTGIFYCLRWMLPLRTNSRARRQARRILTTVAAVGIGMIALVETFLSPVKPYKELSDQENRAAIMEIASQTRPGDQWVVYNSLKCEGHVASDFEQGVARMSYYILQYSKLSGTPVQWSPPAESVKPASGRTWVLAYTLPDEPADAKGLTDYADILGRQLSPPRCREYKITPNSRFAPKTAIEAYQYDAIRK